MKVIALDPADSTCAMWDSGPEGDKLYVSWDGDMNNGELDDGYWPEEYRFVQLTDAQFDTLIMLASHGAWGQVNGLLHDWGVSWRTAEELNLPVG